MAMRKPTHNLAAFNKITGQRNNHLGVAWQNDNGTINIKFNACTRIDSNNPDFTYTLFPNKEREEAPTKTIADPRPDTHFPDDFDDDIPF